MFSRTFGYALRAVVYVATYGSASRKIGLLELSQQLDVPHHFLGKIMQDVVRHRVIDSAKGPSGGFFPNGRTLSAHLIEILRFTDGMAPFTTCALGNKFCNADHPCPLHNDFVVYRDGMARVLGDKTIGDLVVSIREGNTFLSTLIV